MGKITLPPIRELHSDTTDYRTLIAYLMIFPL